MKTIEERRARLRAKLADAAPITAPVQPDDTQARLDALERRASDIESTTDALSQALSDEGESNV